MRRLVEILLSTVQYCFDSENMIISHLDHLVLTIKDINKTIHFYCDILGMELLNFANNRKALGFGAQKINLHIYGEEFEPKAQEPRPGSADLCFITETPLDEVISLFQKHQIKILDGPVTRTGACGPILSIYVRDPDENLIEISNHHRC